MSCMTTMIKGITVTLVTLEQTGTDPFGAPVYGEVETDVENVLVAPSTTDDITRTEQLYGKKAVYTMAIPKGDTHTWQDQKVRFFGETWRVFGFPETGIEANVPLDWNTKWQVERYG